jgi:hypothetical protein
MRILLHPFLEQLNGTIGTVGIRKNKFELYGFKKGEELGYRSLNGGSLISGWDYNRNLNRSTHQQIEFVAANLFVGQSKLG